MKQCVKEWPTNSTSTFIRDAFIQEVVSRLSNTLDAVMYKDGSNAPSVETSSSPKGLCNEKMRELPTFDFKEGQNNSILSSSIVHKLTLDDIIPLDCATNAYRVSTTKEK